MDTAGFDYGGFVLTKDVFVCATLTGHSCATIIKLELLDDQRHSSPDQFILILTAQIYMHLDHECRWSG